VSATRLLELSRFDVPTAMKNWAGFQGAIMLDESSVSEGDDENCACAQREEERHPRAQALAKRRRAHDKPLLFRSHRQGD
jgi:hypothetical protein